MTISRRLLLGGAAGLLAAPAIVRAQGNTAIRIGEINSYTAAPAFTLPYRSGWQLAVEQVNAAGGVLGRKIEVISRDDAGRPPDAIRLAGELLDDQKVDLLAGTFLSNIGLAISDFAKQRKKLFVGGEPLRWYGKAATATASACARPPTCRRRCWSMTRPSSTPNAG
jgi:branched-chain amino acid transport system substrate-binding protein